ncbi:alpha/beta fold hydrolase [Synechococcus sp. CCY 9618]|uniref:alpha/beta fold hydrolase n=1 Tax=Synechococcus sp. CCY 9618 TaxID=2815602 RepID=UPI001C2398D5|nr:alpha/beta fold hydrolase [Synechococcus sp. CCY 9618]
MTQTFNAKKSTGQNQCQWIAADVPTKRLNFQGFNFSYKHINPQTSKCIPTLFISGAFQSMQSWYRFAKYFLTKGKPVIMVDLPGTGESDPLPSDFGQDFLAESIGLMLADAGVERVSIVAASYGTPTAYCFSQAFPDKIEQLILCGTMREIPDYVKEGLSHTLITLKSGSIENFANEVMGFSGPYQGQGLLCTDSSRKITKHKVAMRLLYGQLISMTPLEKTKYELNTLRLIKHGSMDLNDAPACNTLIFTGEHDCFTLPCYGKEMANLLKDCTFTTVRHADHLVHIEQFNTTAELIYHFSYGIAINSISNLNPIERLGTRHKLRDPQFSSAPHPFGAVSDNSSFHHPSCAPLAA